ncbi:MAG: hypothetical protein ACI9UA_000790 [Pseudoalteromonas tetraodonis]|jgi:hypothetical protein
MKSKLYHFLVTAALGVTFLASDADAKSVKVTITMTDDRVITGFVTNGNSAALLVASLPNAPSGPQIARSKITSIFWEEPEEWKAAWKLWTRRDYIGAAKSFEEVATVFGNLTQIEDSFGSKAKYYQVESLRRAGEYENLRELADETRRVSLSKSYQKQIQLFDFWGHVGEKLWEPLKLLTDRFEMDEASVPSHTVPPNTMGFKSIEADLMIQIAFMRGIATENLMRKAYKSAEAAVNPQLPETAQAASAAWADVKVAMVDYSRVYTLTYMSDQLLSKQAMEQCLGILKDDPNIEDNYQLQKEAYAVASFYKDLFGKGKVPAGCEGFLKEPTPPESISEEVEEVEPAPAKEAPAEKKKES